MFYSFWLHIMKKLLRLLPVLLLVWCASQIQEVKENVDTVELAGENYVFWQEVTPATELVVFAKFTDEFVDKWEYDASCNFRFALWVDIKWDGDLYFYDVFRNEAGWVDNDSKRMLQWARPACEFVDGVTREIPLSWDVVRANKSSDWVWYHYWPLWELSEKTKFGLSGIKEWKTDFYTIEIK